MKRIYIKPAIEQIPLPRLMDTPTASLGDEEVEDFDAKSNFGDMEEIEYDMWK